MTHLHVQVYFQTIQQPSNKSLNSLNSFRGLIQLMVILETLFYGFP